MKKEIEVSTLRTGDPPARLQGVEHARGVEKNEKNNFWKKLSDSFLSIEEKLQDCLVIMSKNPVEKDPLILEDAQGRQRVVTMQANANRVSNDIRKLVGYIALGLGLEAGVFGGLAAQKMTPEDLGDAISYLKKDIQSEMNKQSEQIGRARQEVSKELDIKILDQILDTQSALEMIQKRLEERKVERATTKEVRTASRSLKGTKL